MKRTPLRRFGAIRKRRKFSNVPRVYKREEYASRLEADYAAELDLRLHAVGRMRIKSWKRQVPVALEVNGKLICRYIVDFVIEHWDSSIEWVECKGFETETWKLKEKLFRALYPERRLTIHR